MSGPKTDGILKQYASLMDELKQRSILLGLLTENRLNLPAVPNFELCQLQIRSICEILALACLTAHDDIPAVKQSLLQTEYNAEKIFKRLARIHPSFYPVPHDREVTHIDPNSGQKQFHMTLKSGGFLTKDEATKAYNDCGNYLHRGSIRRLITKWYPDIDFTKIQKWNERLGNLLGPYHYIALEGGNGYILCVMNNIDADNAVQCVMATALGEGAAI